MISRKTFIQGSLSTAALLTLSGCSAKSNTNPKDITFVLDYTPNTNHLGLYVAKHLGYYADAGLNVTFVQPPEDGADALVATDSAQFGISFQDWMATYLGSNNPLPVTAVAAIIQHNTSGIMSPQAKHITRPREMTDTVYGTLDVKSEQAIIEELVTLDGGDFASVELISANTTDEVSGLKADQFDSVWVYEAWGLQNAYLQNYPVNYFSIAEQNPTFDYYTPVIIANNTFLAEHADIVRAFLKATAEGYKYASEHVDEASGILCEEVPELDRDLVFASAEYLAPRYAADAKQWGMFDETRWNAFYEWMNEHNLCEIKIPLSTAYTNDYLPGQE